MPLPTLSRPRRHTRSVAGSPALRCRHASAHLMYRRAPPFVFRESAARERLDIVGSVFGVGGEPVTHTKSKPSVPSEDA